MLASLKVELAQLEGEISAYGACDPIKIEEKKRGVILAKEAAIRWTGRFATPLLRPWLKSRRQLFRPVVSFQKTDRRRGPGDQAVPWSRGRVRRYLLTSMVDSSQPNKFCMHMCYLPVLIPFLVPEVERIFHRNKLFNPLDPLCSLDSRTPLPVDTTATES